MSWEEISRRYDREKTGFQLLERAPEFGKGWGRIMRSTDKLVWLFMLSNGTKPRPVAALQRTLCATERPVG